MIYTDEQIIQSLPPALQGDLKAFGPLETKTAAELRKFLLDKREQYQLPPWHVFTLLLKRAAQATGEGSLMNRDSCWYARDTQSKVTDEDYVLSLSNEPSWCILALTLKNNRGEEAEETIAVQPSKKLIWKYNTESPCRALQLLCRAKNSNSYVNIQLTKIMKQATRTIKHKQRHGVLVHVARKITNRSHNKAIEQAQPEHVSVVEPVAVRAGSISETQKEIIRTLLDMAAVKARELNMHTTIVRWRHALENIIGKESANAES